MYDSKLILKDAGEVTSTAYAQVGGSDQVVNLGTGKVKGKMDVLVDSIKVSDNDEAYDILLFGGDDESFTNEVLLAHLELGANEALSGNVDSQAGVFIVPFTNEQNGTIYPYVRAKHEIAGTSPAIDYKAYLTHQ